MTEPCKLEFYSSSNSQETVTTNPSKEDKKLEQEEKKVEEKKNKKKKPVELRIEDEFNKTELPWMVRYFPSKIIG